MWDSGIVGQLEKQIMTHTRLFFVAVCLSYFGGVSLQAQSTSNGWEELGLDSMRLDRATVYYEKAFEPNLPFFEKAYNELLNSWDESKAVNIKRDVLLSEINHILGIQDPDTELQNKIWASLTGTFSSVEEITFYLVKQSTVKDTLRNGGTLPDFTHDKATDEVAYNFSLSGSSKDGPVKTLEWACPIKSEQTFEKDVAKLSCCAG